MDKLLQRTKGFSRFNTLERAKAFKNRKEMFVLQVKKHFVVNTSFIKMDKNFEKFRLIKKLL
jgi:hypothetical protein